MTALSWFDSPLSSIKTLAKSQPLDNATACFRVSITVTKQPRATSINSNEKTLGRNHSVEGLASRVIGIPAGRTTERSEELISFDRPLSDG